MSTADTQLRQTEDFLKKAYRAALIPGMLSILSGCANILADGILVSRYVGADGLAAVNLCTPVYLILCIVGSFFVSGGAILSAQEMGNNQMMQNPMIKNVVQMAQKGNMQGIEQMARNLCKEKGLNADDVFNQIKSNMNM